MIKISIIVEPVDVVVEHLRANYKEPARSSLSKRHTTTSENFSGNDVTVEFTVTNTRLLCINSISISSVAQTKYEHYNIDLRNNKIVFVTAPASGSNNITVSYDYNTSGISWIYPDKSLKSKLVRTDYPRVTVSMLNEKQTFRGFNSDKQLGEMIFQIDIATKEGITCTNYVEYKIDGTTQTITENHMGEQTTQIISRNLWHSIKHKWRTELLKKFFCPPDALRQNQRVAYDESIGLFRRSVDVALHGYDPGEAS